MDVNLKKGGCRILGIYIKIAFLSPLSALRLKWEYPAQYLMNRLFCQYEIVNEYSLRHLKYSLQTVLNRIETEEAKGSSKPKVVWSGPKK